MIESSSNKLRIRPSESIKPEPLDERILDATKIVNWSTFRCGLSQLKSRIIWPRGEVSDLILTNIPHRILLNCKFQIRSYLSLEQREKNPPENNKTTKPQHLYKKVEVFLFLNVICYVFWNLYFWIVPSLFPYLPRQSVRTSWVPAREEILSLHLYLPHTCRTLQNVSQIPCSMQGAHTRHVQPAPLLYGGGWQWIQNIKGLLEIHI